MSFTKCAAVLGLVASTLALPQPLSLIKRQSLGDFDDSKSRHNSNLAKETPH
jgi:hypothetical protein